jgi:hypothetical protein
MLMRMILIKEGVTRARLGIIALPLEQATSAKGLSQKEIENALDHDKRVGDLEDLRNSTIGHQRVGAFQVGGIFNGTIRSQELSMKDKGKAIYKKKKELANFLFPLCSYFLLDSSPFKSLS